MKMLILSELLLDTQSRTLRMQIKKSRKKQKSRKKKKSRKIIQLECENNNCEPKLILII